MAEISKERMDEAIARAKKEVANEVQDHQAEDKDLEDVAGGVAGGVAGNDTGTVVRDAPAPVWMISISYST